MLSWVDWLGHFRTFYFFTVNAHLLFFSWYQLILVSFVQRILLQILAKTFFCKEHCFIAWHSWKHFSSVNVDNDDTSIESVLNLGRCCFFNPMSIHVSCPTWSSMSLDVDKLTSAFLLIPPLVNLPLLMILLFVFGRCA